ncbi:MAG: Nif3-like dinuclear metal center hexameric protein [Cytophagaceae bacterium]|nr:Nif3-like dinuclear metal center hexameric protein [Cytophagaceae bacterium]
MTKINDLSKYLETLAPLAYQEAYDNAGLLVGDPQAEVRAVLVSLDCTEAVIAEAMANDCNVVVAHHPIVFKGLKRLTGKNYVERAVIRAIKHDVALYAIHTNLDSVRGGVNWKIAERLGLRDVRVLVPKRQMLLKLVAFVPVAATPGVLDALFAAGAGQIGEYHNCSFRTEGKGTFKPTGSANPVIGELGRDEEVPEHRVEVLFPAPLEGRVMAALRAAHPYEEVAYYLQRLENENQDVGAGAIGLLPKPLSESDFLAHLKTSMKLPLIRHTALRGRPIQNVALCGGAGSFLLGDALRQGADAFVTADFKYHEFFDAEGQTVICDIGHYESEVFTSELLRDELTKKFTTFAVKLSETPTNPVNYYV